MGSVTRFSECNCGAPYVRAGTRAAEAVAANPGKSDRAIAEEIGVDHKTVGKARKATGDYSPVQKRTDKDGKARRVPHRQPVEEYKEPGIEVMLEICDEG